MPQEDNFRWIRRDEDQGNSRVRYTLYYINLTLKTIFIILLSVSILMMLDIPAMYKMLVLAVVVLLTLTALVYERREQKDFQRIQDREIGKPL